MHDVHVEPTLEQPARRLEPEQTAADHRGRPRARHVLDHAVAVVQRAEGEERRPSARVPWPLSPFIGGTNALLPVANTSTSYGSSTPLSPRTSLRVAVDARHAHARVQRDAVLARTTSSGLMKMSSGSCVPASTPDSRMRL